MPLTMKTAWLYVLLPALALLACTATSDNSEAGARQGHANKLMHRSSIESLIAGFESPARDAWQKPDTVMAMLGDLQGKTVMDLGSGSGYFSFRLAAAGARVICADVDEAFLAHIRERMQSADIGEDVMELRHVPYDSAQLQPAEVDMVLIVDTYHHVEDRVAYFAELRDGLKTDGRLVVIDFFKRNLPVGPPASTKIAHEQVVQELRAAGFTTFATDVDSLPYQYVIAASR